MKLTRSAVNRRRFLGRTSQGVFGVALASLLDPSLLQAAPPRGVLGTLPLAAKGQAGDLAHDGGRPLASGTVRPQAEARRD